MATIRRLSMVDQTTAHLREGVLSGRWNAKLPGMRALAVELGVARHTLRAAIVRLVSEGLLAAGATGESYAIVTRPAPAPGAARRCLRVAMVLPRALEHEGVLFQASLLRVDAELRADGHSFAMITLPSGKDRHKTGYLPRLVEESAADAWIIITGTVEVLEWFIARNLPALAMGGRCPGLPIAATGFVTVGVLREATRRLIDLGHRRIVFIGQSSALRPTFSPAILAFREELDGAGVRPGLFHTPEWDETPAGLVALLDSLFKVTPPTALLCWTPNATAGALSWLARRGLRVPADVSVVALRDDPTLAWHFPGIRIAHAVEEDATTYRRIREWVLGVAAGNPDKRQLWTGATLYEGNTLGPAKSG